MLRLPDNWGVDTLALVAKFGVWLLSLMSEHNATHYCCHANERMNAKTDG